MVNRPIDTLQSRFLLRGRPKGQKKKIRKNEEISLNSICPLNEWVAPFLRNQNTQRKRIIFFYC